MGVNGGNLAAPESAIIYYCRGSLILTTSSTWSRNCVTCSGLPSMYDDSDDTDVGRAFLGLFGSKGDESSRLLVSVAIGVPISGQDVSMTP